MKNQKSTKCSVVSAFLVLTIFFFLPTMNDMTSIFLRAEDVTGLSYDDEKLIAFTKRFFVPPSSLAYNLDNDNVFDYSEFETSTTVMNLLKNRTNGFFVECGALTGELISNTLMMEKYFGWTGLLVEAAPNNVKFLLQKNRKAWIAPACMSVNNTADIVSFSDYWVFGKVVGEKGNKVNVNFTDVLCIPLNTMMAALGKTKIDYFSLDVEGSELEILKTIDFKNIQIDIMTVEHLHNTEIHDQIVQHMEANNFKMHLKGAYDFYFVNNEIADLI